MLKYQKYPQGESNTWGTIVKGKLALPMSCTSYQECGCHIKINREINAKGC